MEPYNNTTQHSDICMHLETSKGINKMPLYSAVEYCEIKSTYLIDVLCSTVASWFDGLLSSAMRGFEPLPGWSLSTEVCSKLHIAQHIA